MTSCRGAALHFSLFDFACSVLTLRHRGTSSLPRTSSTGPNYKQLKIKQKGAFRGRHSFLKHLKIYYQRLSENMRPFWSGGYGALFISDNGVKKKNKSIFDYVVYALFNNNNNYYKFRFCKLKPFNGSSSSDVVTWGGGTKKGNDRKARCVLGRLVKHFVIFFIFHIFALGYLIVFKKKQIVTKSEMWRLSYKERGRRRFLKKKKKDEG